MSDADFYFQIFQVYVGLTLSMIVIKVRDLTLRYHTKCGIDAKMLIQTIIRIVYWKKILGGRCVAACFIICFIAICIIELSTDFAIGTNGYKYAFGNGTEYTDQHAHEDDVAEDDVLSFFSSQNDTSLKAVFCN